jgi:hypothetical protein
MTTASSYWLDPYWLKTWKRTEIGTPEYAMKLSAVRRGISNFVRIVTKEDISVRYSSGQMSYATRETGIVISATNDPSDLDMMVGIALHESAHLILSRVSNHPESIPVFEWLGWAKDYLYDLIPEEIVNKGTQCGVATDAELYKHFRMLLNVLEDRRIDNWMYERAVGYRPYYDEVYARKWNSPKVSLLLNDPKTHQPCVKNYLFHIINISNPDAPLDALPGMLDIRNLINLAQVRRFGLDEKWYTWQNLGPARIKTKPFSALPEMIRVVIAVMDLMYTRSLQATVPLPQPEFGDDESQEPSPSPEPPEDEPDDPNLDLPDEDEQQASDGGDEESDEEDEKNSDSADETQAELDRQVKFLDDDFDKSELDDEIESQVQAMEESQAGLEVVGGEDGWNVPVIVYRKLTEDVLKNPQFDFASLDRNDNLNRNPESERAILIGERLGDALAGRIILISEERELVYPRQQHGRLDRRLLSNLGYGDTSVFSTLERESHRPVVIHLSIDASISMKGIKWVQSLALGVALAKCASRVKNLDVVVSIRAGGSHQNPQIAIIHDSRTESFVQVRRLWPYLVTTWGTPEGLCFEAVRKDVMGLTTQADRYFINISDGDPQMILSLADGNTRFYSGKAAYINTRRQVDAFKRAGIAVMSYFVKGDPKDQLKFEKGFREMYGNSAQFINPESVVDIARTLNSLLIN